jgi:hypothetical protein
MICSFIIFGLRQYPDYMKKTLLLVCGLIAALTAGAQTLVFHEDFETADSVTSSGNPTWSSNTTYQAGGLRSYRNQIALNDSSKLTTISFSTLGNSFVLLDFDQICKIQFFDNARLEVSNDNGNTWQPVVGANYLGTGQFATINNRFCAGSYSNWQPGQDAAVPSNTWWQHETFDISNLCGNAANVMIRFKLNDGNNNGPNGAYGWLLDNIEVTVAPSELNPPVITYISPIYLNNLFSLGPFSITTSITDASGVDTATVYYTVNGGPQQAVGMNNTTGTTWVGIIPTVSDSDTVCYYVTAFDASPAANTATAPTSGCRQFVAFAGIVFPFFDNFETNNGLWTVQTPSGTSNWQYGTPAFGATTGAYSGVNAWDVNLTSAYGPGANTQLLTPVFDFSQAVNAKMSFWHNYNAENSWDGVRIEYTTDGNTWQLLGNVVDPNAINWYTYPSLLSSNLPGWEGQSSGWVQSEYRLSVLNNVVGPVQFKFIFTSDGSVQYDGYSIDDFLIRLPSPQDAEMDAVVVPDVSGCVAIGSNNVSVAIFNDGSQNIVGPMNVTYVIDNGTPVTEQYTGTIVPSQTDTFNFATPFNVTAGTHTITVYTSLTNDGFLLNDTLTYTFLAIAPVNLPYFNGFEAATSLNDFCVTGSTYGQVNLSTAAANVGSQGAVMDAIFSGNWDFGSDTIISSPSYIWQPTQSEEHRSNLRLVVNTATYNNLVLEFDAQFLYNFGNEYTNFRVKVNGNMITPHFQPNNATSPYTSYRYDLSSFLPASSLTIDFEAKVYDNYLNGSGVFLDQVRIYEPQPFDVMMMNILQPASQQAANSQATVQVQLRNVGINTLTSIPVTYQVGANTPVTQTWTGNLPPNASTNFTFTTQFTAPTGQFTICAWTSLPNDGDLTNDSACKNSTGIPLLPVPFSDNFDGPSTFFAAQNTYTPSWELGTPAAPYITNAHTAPNAWEVNLNGAYQSNSMEYLYTPFFDFSSASSVQMRFWQWYSTDFGSDGGFIQYSADGGVTWQVLGVQNDPLGVFWYGQANIWASNTPGWSGPGAAYFQSRYNLSFLSNNPLPVQFRFVFASDGFTSTTVDGWAIDDFELIIMVGQEEHTLSGVQLSSYPNPASETATITYSVPQAGQVTLALRDVMGKEIISETTEATTGTQFWNVDVSTLPDGVYFYELIYHGTRSVQRLVVNH